MANLNPSPATRWQPGQSGNAGRTGPRRRTILARVPVVRSLEEVKSKEGSWRGSMRDLIEVAARDPENDLSVRLAAAAQLLRHELDAPPPDRMANRPLRISIRARWLLRSATYRGTIDPPFGRSSHLTCPTDRVPICTIKCAVSLHSASI